MTQIAFAGNMTAPVELRFTANGKAVANVTVAVNRKVGEDEATDFHRVTLWESLAEHAASLEKGTRVVVIGRLTQREFEDRDGNKQQAWDVTASSFGPDLRWADVTVTRAQSNRAVDRPLEPVSQPSDSWTTPAGGGGFDDSQVPF